MLMEPSEYDLINRFFNEILKNPLLSLPTSSPNPLLLCEGEGGLIKIFLISPLSWKASGVVGGEGVWG